MKIKTLLTRCLMRLCGIFPMQDKAVFCAYYGKYHNCNPHSVFTEMQRQRPDWTYVWLMQDDSVQIEGATVVRPHSLKAIYHLATAAIWVDNARKPLWTVKRRGQYYVQTWHGGIALKQVEKDAEESLTEEYIANAKNDSACADLFLSGSRWQTQNYKDAFWYDGDILEYGLPRSDVLFRPAEKTRQQVCDFYGLSDDTHLLLYAPTFRASYTLSPYLTREQCETLLEALAARFGGKWAALVRLHPNVAEKQNAISYSDTILNGSKYNEINDLILACDVLITDYSSCMFDAMSAKKTVFLYLPDREAYLSDRGFYWDMAELPFAKADTCEGLVQNIHAHEAASYEAAVADFEAKTGIVCNANASRDAVSYILAQCGRG